MRALLFCASGEACLACELCARPPSRHQLMIALPLVLYCVASFVGDASLSFYRYPVLQALRPADRSSFHSQVATPQPCHRTEACTLPFTVDL
eukprot:6187813-Pleurochrysis_carterae.AAC.1